MKTKQNGHIVLLLLTALIWGFAFVAQRISAGYVGACTYNFIRFSIGGVSLLPLIYVLDKKKAEGDSKKGFHFRTNPNLVKGGIACGILIGCASIVQQIGIANTTAGKAGFITAFYIVAVPLIGLFIGRKASRSTWLAVLASLCGMYLLCVDETLSINMSDIYVLMGALLFAAHIMVIDRFSPLVDGVKLSCIQFFIAAIICGVGTIIFETWSWADIMSALPALLYSGILSCGVAYTLQIIGQNGVNPTVAALVLSLESVFAVVGDWLVLGNVMNFKELAGCGIIFLAVIMAQLPDKRLKVNKDIQEGISRETVNS